jgi:hypothetical protein
MTEFNNLAHCCTCLGWDEAISLLSLLEGRFSVPHESSCRHDACMRIKNQEMKTGCSVVAPN